MRFSKGLMAALARQLGPDHGVQLPQALAQSSSGAFSIPAAALATAKASKTSFTASETKPNRRSNYFLILKKTDRDKAIMKLDVMVPSYFDSKLKTKTSALLLHRAERER